MPPPSSSSSFLDSFQYFTILSTVKHSLLLEEEGTKTTSSSYELEFVQKNVSEFDFLNLRRSLGTFCKSILPSRRYIQRYYNSKSNMNCLYRHENDDDNDEWEMKEAIPSSFFALSDYNYYFRISKETSRLKLSDIEADINYDDYIIYRAIERYSFMMDNNIKIDLSKTMTISSDSLEAAPSARKRKESSPYRYEIEIENIVEDKNTKVLNLKVDHLLEVLQVVLGIQNNYHRLSVPSQISSITNIFIEKYYFMLIRDHRMNKSIFPPNSLLWVPTWSGTTSSSQYFCSPSFHTLRCFVFHYKNSWYLIYSNECVYNLLMDDDDPLTKTHVNDIYIGEEILFPQRGEVQVLLEDILVRDDIPCTYNERVNFITTIDDDDDNGEHVNVCGVSIRRKKFQQMSSIPTDDNNNTLLESGALGWSIFSPAKKMAVFQYVLPLCYTLLLHGDVLPIPLLSGGGMFSTPSGAKVDDLDNVPLHVPLNKSGGGVSDITEGTKKFYDQMYLNNAKELQREEKEEITTTPKRINHHPEIAAFIEYLQTNILQRFLLPIKNMSQYGKEFMKMRVLEYNSIHKQLYSVIPTGGGGTNSEGPENSFMRLYIRSRLQHIDIICDSSEEMVDLDLQKSKVLASTAAAAAAASTNHEDLLQHYYALDYQSFIQNRNKDLNAYSNTTTLNEMISFTIDKVQQKQQQQQQLVHNQQSSSYNIILHLFTSNINFEDALKLDKFVLFTKHVLDNDYGYYIAIDWDEALIQRIFTLSYAVAAAASSSMYTERLPSIHILVGECPDTLLILQEYRDNNTGSGLKFSFSFSHTHASMTYLVKKDIFISELERKASLFCIESDVIKTNEGEKEKDIIYDQDSNSIVFTIPSLLHLCRYFIFKKHLFKKSGGNTTTGKKIQLI